MEGTSSVLLAATGRGSELARAAQQYLSTLAQAPDLVYASLHGTRQADKFVLIEMFRHGAARTRHLHAGHGRAWEKAKRLLLAEGSAVERIRPLLSTLPERARPVDVIVPRRARITCPRVSGRRPFGAFVRVFPKADLQSRFIPILERQGDLIAASEPGFLFADFYRYDAPESWLVVEYYDDRASFSYHHTLAHTLAFADMKARAGYELRKHKAFTIRPIAAVGPFARRFEPVPDTGKD